MKLFGGSALITVLGTERLLDHDRYKSGDRQTAKWFGKHSGVCGTILDSNVRFNVAVKQCRALTILARKARWANFLLTETLDSSLVRAMPVPDRG